MSFKIPCGGFKLDEKSFSLDENGVLSVSGGGSVPKPLTYDYMPEGYPKKDGWSVEWDGNIDGKVNASGTPFYKFSDRVLTYEEFLSANYIVYAGGEQYSGMVSESRPEQEQIADSVSLFNFTEAMFFVVSEDNVELQGAIFPTKGLYSSVDYAPPFKLIKETITPMSTDFMPLASDTEPGLVPSLNGLFSVVLQQVHDEYFAGTEIQNPDYSSAQSIQEFALKNNSYGIFQPGKFSGKVLNAHNSLTNKYLTVVLAASDKVECRKFTSGSTDIEQLWCISKDGVIIPSSTPDSTKKFKITVDDSGTISATEVT